MGTNVISTPGGIAFAGFYYPEILREELQFLRRNKERLGLTDENEFEVHMQLLRSFAAVGHLNNAHLDTVATELLIDSATLLESIKRLLRLVGVELSSAYPSAVDIILKLSEVTTSDVTDFIPELAEYATTSTPPIIFESLSGLDLDRTDQVRYVFGLEETDNDGASDYGSVLSSTPDIFRRISGTWASDVVAQHLFVRGSLVDNGGEFRVTQRLNDTDLRVARIPGSKNPGFQNESGLSWSLKKFTTDYAAKANADSDPFDPWTTLHANDALYIGHRQVLSDQLDVVLSTPVGANFTGVFEYFDNERSKFNPSSVTDLGSTLRFNINTLLGTTDRTGAEVTVTYLVTGAKETVTSTFTSSENRITTSGLLGQTSPSTDPLDYHVTCDWVPFANQVDSTSDFSSSDKVEWDLPETLERSWIETDVNLYDAYWIRYRVVSVSTPTEPKIDRLKINLGDQYIKDVGTQGETIGPQIIGSSNGSARQTFELPDTPFIDDTELIEVDETGSGGWVEWTRVVSFSNSTTSSRHYVRRSSAEDVAEIRFGDGINGKIPVAGSDNIRGTYRVGGDVDGNVGANTVVVDRDGILGVSEVWNPRPATGWRMKDGGDDDDIERVKRDKPAEVQTRGTASTAPDVKRLAVNQFTDSAGTKPVFRAVAEEEKYGVKTIGLMVVGDGGSTLTATQIEELEEYFNGDRYARPPVEGVLVANHEVTATNYQPKKVTVEVVVAWKDGSAERIRNALLAYLMPLALKSDGVTYVWDFGSVISLSQVHSLIHGVDPNIKDVPTLKLCGVAANLDLDTDELPISTATDISVTIQET